MCAQREYTMKRIPVIVLSCLAGLLSACTRAELVPRVVTPSPVPELLVTHVVPTFDPAWLPTPTPADTPTPWPSPTLPARTVAAPTDTPPPPLPPLSPTAVPTSAGPLSVNAYLVECRLAPTPDKPGNIVVRLSIEATGGGGGYRYFVQGAEINSKFADVQWAFGARLIVPYRVTSGDGQTVTREFNASPAELNCR